MARSKQQFRSSPGSSLPEIFCDRSLGRMIVPERLREAYEGAVVAHDDRFPQDSDDQTWLTEAGVRNWIVLTKDEKIRYRPGEREVLLAAEVPVFCLHPSRGMTGEEMAQAFVVALPKIIRISEVESGGFMRGVNRKGEIRQLYP